MKPRIIGLAVALLFVSATVCAAQTAHMGTWKLNEAKSHFSKGASKNMTVVYETAGEDIKVTVDGVDGDGAFTHNEWIGKFDGKDYAVTGDPTADTRAYRRLNSRTLALTNKKDGKITTTGRIVVSPNGRSRTVTTTTWDPKGRRVTNIAVYEGRCVVSSEPARCSHSSQVGHDFPQRPDTLHGRCPLPNLT